MVKINTKNEKQLIFWKGLTIVKVQSFRLIMENIIIQMAASAGHGVATLSIVCRCVLQMASRMLYFKASIVSGLSA